MGARRTGSDLPLVLTVKEAAAVLRVSPSTLYEHVHRYFATNGREGFPAVRLGRRVLVPRDLMEKHLNGMS
jgi:excisionase family DNA binding protein